MEKPRVLQVPTKSTAARRARAPWTVSSYVVLTFAISWGGFLLAGWRGLVAGSDWQSDPTFPLAVLAMLAGPPAAGILSSILAEGRDGPRDILARLLRWRVGGGWYAFALPAAPLLQLAVLLAPSTMQSGSPTSTSPTSWTRRTGSRCCWPAPAWG